MLVVKTSGKHGNDATMHLFRSVDDQTRTMVERRNPLHLGPTSLRVLSLTSIVNAVCSEYQSNECLSLERPTVAVTQMLNELIIVSFRFLNIVSLPVVIVKRNQNPRK